MPKPKNRFFLISSNSDEIKNVDMLSRLDAEAAAANVASDAEGEYIFVAELISTHWQTKDSSSTPYTENDTYGP